MTITVDDVKRKCMIAGDDDSHDDSIEARIAEMQPALEFTLDPLYLNETGDAKLQALLQLGALELIAAEFLAQRWREAGFAEEFQAGGVRVGQFWERGKQLLELGTARLAPFRRSLAEASGETRVIASAPGDRQFTDDTMRGW